MHMNTPDWWEEAESGIHSAVAQFSNRVRDKITSQPPGKLLATKNPFLFRARVTTDPDLLARMIVDAFLSSSEETMFGNVLERIALAICTPAKGGRKSSTANIDLEYDEDGQRTIIQIKSGPNWGNSSQRRKLEADFNTARRTIIQGDSTQVIRCVEGICYGSSRTKYLGSHWQLIGNHFWYDISGWDGTAQAVLSVIGLHAENGLADAREQAKKELVSYLNAEGVVSPDGYVKWETLLGLVL